MSVNRFGSWIVLSLLAHTGGCTGNGDGLDANGQPLVPGGGSNGPITADFKSIQDHVFTPICSKCHIGASAPEGLQLDAAHSYDLLVGVLSAEKPAQLRVKPNDPDASYMVQKIQGSPGIDGGQMPLGQTPLPQATIDAIRQWITDGAANVPTTAAAAAFAVKATLPMPESLIDFPLRQIVVTFNHEVDASLVNDTTVTLQRLDAGMAPQPLPIRLTLASGNTSAVLMTPITVLVSGTYRVTLRGSGGGGLADLNAKTLASDVTFEFTVDRVQ